MTPYADSDVPMVDVGIAYADGIFSYADGRRHLVCVP
jgi:hypothetical protein